MVAVTSLEGAVPAQRARVGAILRLFGSNGHTSDIFVGSAEHCTRHLIANASQFDFEDLSSH